jgi:hypothetical protein
MFAYSPAKRLFKPTYDLRNPQPSLKGHHHLQLDPTLPAGLVEELERNGIGLCLACYLGRHKFSKVASQSFSYLIQHILSREGLSVESVINAAATNFDIYCNLRLAYIFLAEYAVQLT